MSRPPLSFPKSAASQKALLLLVVVVVFARSIDGRHTNIIVKTREK